MKEGIGMTTRSILHISKLNEFENFLENKGYMIVATSKSPYEVLRAVSGNDTVIVYKKADAKEHLSTMDKDYHLVREFIKSQRIHTVADKIRGMADEEMAKYLCEKFCHGIGEDLILNWLRGKVE